MGRIHVAGHDFAATLEDHLDLLHAHVMACRSCRTFFSANSRRTICGKGGDLFAAILLDYSRIRFVTESTEQKRASARFINSIRRTYEQPLACELDNMPTLF